MIQEIKTIPTKHIFIDVVGFTQNRSVEAQVEIIYVLNEIVRNAIKKFNIGDEQVIFLPTGDGMDIALLNIEDPYDVHILISLEILAQIEAHCNSFSNAQGVDNNHMRSFKIRIGINSNVDNVITDINGNKNISGAGINVAQRVMNTADASQVMVSATVFDMLRYREKYMNCFKSYSATVKHGVTLTIYQLQISGIEGLDVSIPQTFVPKTTPTINKFSEQKLNENHIYYMAYVAYYKDEILKLDKYERDDFIILFWFWAMDSVGLDKSTITYPYSLHTPSIGETMSNQIKNIQLIPYEYKSKLKSYIIDTEIKESGIYFESQYTPLFLNEKGIKRLQDEFEHVVEKIKAPEWIKQFHTSTNNAIKKSILGF